MPLPSRLTRLERRIAALQPHRAAKAARIAAFYQRYPRAFDRWLWAISTV